MDALCDNCQDLADARLADIAHELVDDSNDIYRYAPMYTPLLKISENISGHEWVSPTQIVAYDKYGEPIVRKENYEGEIQARMESISFDDDTEIPHNQVVCQWCNLTTLAQVKCVNCDEYVS